MTTQSKAAEPSAGALRAINVFREKHAINFAWFRTPEQFAEIIDRETHAGALLEALERIANGSLSRRCPLCHKTTEFSGNPRINNHEAECPCAIAEAAIRKAKGEL